MARIQRIEIECDVCGDRYPGGGSSDGAIGRISMTCGEAAAVRDAHQEPGSSLHRNPAATGMERHARDLCGRCFDRLREVLEHEFRALREKRPQEKKPKEPGKDGAGRPDRNRGEAFADAIRIAQEIGAADGKQTYSATTLMHKELVHGGPGDTISDAIYLGSTIIITSMPMNNRRMEAIRGILEGTYSPL